MIKKERPNPRVVVVHPDRQHSLKTAKALQDAGLLCRYFTTVYTKKHSLSRLLARIVPLKYKKKFDKHYLEGLDENKVTLCCEGRMLLLSILGIVFPGLVAKFRKSVVKSFNKKCLDICKKIEFDILISYDTLSGSAFDELKNKGVVLVLDMSAPCYLSMLKEYRADVDKNLDSSDSLKDYIESDISNWKMKMCENELQTYDYFIAASNYTKQTLMSNSIDDKQIVVIPYGINFSTNDLRTQKKNDHLICTYVGNVSQQKGCHYIFRYANLFPNISFNLIGAYDNSYKGEIPENCKLWGYLSFDEILNVFTETDVFLFLSLADGFGFAPAEAMAYGIPIICSVNAGIKDYIDDYSGWIITPSDKDAFINIINWCENNKLKLRIKGEKAKNAISSLQWGRYSEELSSFINNIMEVNNGDRC